LSGHVFALKAELQYSSLSFVRSWNRTTDKHFKISLFDCW